MHARSRIRKADIVNLGEAILNLGRINYPARSAKIKIGFDKNPQTLAAISTIAQFIVRDVIHSSQ
jgi:hypothetical protein